MAKITVQQVLQIDLALTDVSKTPMPASISFQIAILKDKTSALAKKFFESRDALFTTLGNEDEKTGQKLIPEENKEEFFREVKELTSVEVEIEIPMLALASLKDVNLPPSFFQVFKDFITE